MLLILLTSFLALACAPRGPAGDSRGGSAASSMENAAGSGLVLTLWHEAEPAVAALLERELAALEPEIRVNVQRRNQALEALKLSAGDPAQAPDLFWSAHDRIGLLAALGILEPLDSILEGAADLLPLARQAVEYQGRAWMVPVTYESLLFLYNRDLMSQPPETTDELLALMEAAPPGPPYVYVEQYSTAYYAAAWIHSFDGYLWNPEQGPGLDLPATARALEYQHQFVEHQPREADWDTVSALFTGGLAASTLNGPWLVPAARAAGINLGLAALPLIPETGRPLGPYVGFQGLMVLAGSPRREAALEVARWLAESPALGLALARESGAAPAHGLALEHSDLADHELVQAIRAAATWAEPMPSAPEMDLVWRATEEALVRINRQGMAAAPELARAQASLLESIARMRPAP